MKSFVVIVSIAFLAGCGHMGMQNRGGMQSSGDGMQGPSSSAYDSADTERNDVFNSWVN